MPISTVHQPAPVGFDTATRARPPAIGMLSTYPPTQCGLATFSAALIQHLHLAAGGLGVVRVVDDPDLRHGPDVVAHLVNGSPEARCRGTSPQRVRRGGRPARVRHLRRSDGVDVLPIVDALTVPTIIVLHTVLQEPTAGQRRILLRLLAAADVVVTMTQTAQTAPGRELRRRPDAGRRDPARRGRPRARLRAERRPAGRPLVLTWGLLGPGKGIEWAIDAMARAERPAARATWWSGQTHPKVAHRDGEAYRDGLVEPAPVRGRRGHRRASTTATSTWARWPGWSSAPTSCCCPTTRASR